MTAVPTTSAAPKGLEGVVAARSAVSFVDGERGRLVYRGYDIHDLARHSTFEETAYLLMVGQLPTKVQLTDFISQVKAAQRLDSVTLRVIRDAPIGSKPMNVLRSATSATVYTDPEKDQHVREAELRKSIRLLAKIPTIITTFHRLRTGERPVSPRKGLSLAANFLHMLRGQVPDDDEARALDVALILHADHEFNASTFVARTIAATLMDVHGAVTGAMAALAGPLHGGANAEVMQMLLEIGSPDRAERWVKDRLAQKQKIMGFGHRVYHTEDPRATHLRQMSEELGKKHGQPQWFEISCRIEEVVRREKGLYCNVDFYSASTYYVMGIPLDLYTPIFAASRVAGWCAHILEQHADNRLIRPRAEYVGPMDLAYLPVRRRK